MSADDYAQIEQAIHYAIGTGRWLKKKVNIAEPPKRTIEGVASPKQAAAIQKTQARTVGVQRSNIQSAIAARPTTLPRPVYPKPPVDLLNYPHQATSASGQHDEPNVELVDEEPNVELVDEEPNVELVDQNEIVPLKVPSHSDRLDAIQQQISRIHEHIAQHGIAGRKLPRVK